MCHIFSILAESTPVVFFAVDSLITAIAVVWNITAEESD